MKAQIGRAFLRANGWTITGGVPPSKKFVLIAAPHTSNWDFPYMIAIAFALGLDIHWLGKQQLFEGSLGPVLNALGGIPVDRSKSTNMVDRLAERFAATDSLVITIPPEGTRGKRDRWKSGFYHVARKAGVPIGLGFLDYAHKTGGIGPLITPTGDVRKDMDTIRAFYSSITGRRPELFTPPRLREEDEPIG